jgi:hypothetical protein
VAKKKDAPAKPAKSRPARAKAAGSKEPASIYTMLLFLSMLAMVLGCIFLFLEMKAYNMQIKVPADAQGSWQAPAIASPVDTQWA